MKSTILEEKPNHIVMYVGTNDLTIDKSLHDIAQRIVDVSMRAIIGNNVTLTISELTCRSAGLRNKAMQVNSVLERMCTERNIGFIRHNNIQPVHLNGSRLHLNKQGTKNMIRNIVTHLEKY